MRISQLLGHKPLILTVIVANRVRKEFSADGNKAVEALIKQTLEALSCSDN